MKLFAVIGTTFSFIMVVTFYAEPVNSGFVEEMQKQYQMLEHILTRTNPEQQIDSLRQAIAESSFPKIISSLQDLLDRYVPKALYENIQYDNLPELSHNAIRALEVYIKTHEWQEIYQILDEVFALSQFQNFVRHHVRNAYKQLATVDFKALGKDTSNYIREFKVPFPIKIIYYAMYEFIRTSDSKKMLGAVVDNLQKDEIFGKTALSYEIIRVGLGLSSLQKFAMTALTSGESFQTLAQLMELMNDPFYGKIMKMISGALGMDIPLLGPKSEEPKPSCPYGVDERGFCKPKPSKQEHKRQDMDEHHHHEELPKPVKQERKGQQNKEDHHHHEEL